MIKCHDKIDRPYFSSCRTTTADGNTRKQNSKCIYIWFCKTLMTTENCYYKKLLKAHLITASSLVTFSAKIRTISVNLY